VTTDAQDLFPSNYDALAAGLLAAIESLGGDDLLEQVFTARRRQLGARVRDQMTERVAPDAPLADRVRELAVIQADNGYLADTTIDASGTIRLREHNCAIYHIAKGSPAACRAELELFREVLGADVVRDEHIASGDRCCSYRIADRTPD
jgi:predicted ArsR family transcriptional regulator